MQEYLLHYRALGETRVSPAQPSDMEIMRLKRASAADVRHGLTADFARLSRTVSEQICWRRLRPSFSLTPCRQFPRLVPKKYPQEDQAGTKKLRGFGLVLKLHICNKH